LLVTYLFGVVRWFSSFLFANLILHYPVKGPKNAPVTIVEFSDFECRFWAEAQDTLNKVLGKYGDSIRLVFRDFPMGDLHKYAYKAAIAAECAQEQGKFWPMHDRMF